MPDDGFGIESPQVVDAEDISLDVGAETLVASAVQSASCCDVWFRVPSSSWNNVVLRLYGRIGAARALLRQVTLDRAPATTDAGMSTGIAISVRGRPVTAFELTCQSQELPVSSGAFYLSVWHAPADLQSSGGDDVPEASTAAPLVAATLLGRDGTTGELRAITTDSSGRLIMANPTFSESDQAMLGAATDAATPSTLVKRDGGGASRFVGLFAASLDHDTPSPGSLFLGTGSGTTDITIGRSGAPTTIWNATFQGTTTVIDSTSLQVTDRVVTVNRTAGPNAPVPSQISGISVMRGDVSGAKRDHAGLFWDESAQTFRLALNSTGDDVTLGAALPLVANEFRGGPSAAAVFGSNTAADGVSLMAGSSTLLNLSDSSGSTKLDSAARPLLITQAQAASGDGVDITIEAQQGASGRLGGQLVLKTGKGGTPGTDLGGGVVIDLGARDRDGVSSELTFMADGSRLGGLKCDGRALVLSNDELTYGGLLIAPNTGPFQVQAESVSIQASSGQIDFTSLGTFNWYGPSWGLVRQDTLQLGATSYVHQPMVTSVTWSQTKRTGTGANAGAPLAVRAQDGQNVASGANNSGGDARLASGSVGTGGTGGLPGAVFLSLGADDSLKLSRVSNANELDFGNTFNATISVAPDATAGATGKSLTVQGAPATGTGAAAGGMVAISGGAGTGGGGGAVQIVGGQSTGGNGSGGEVDILGGAKNGTGKAGNISLHAKTPNFQGGEGILFVGNATTEPTAGPTAGGFLWGRTDGQLTHQGVNGAVSELNPRFGKSVSATSVKRLRRADNATISSATTTTVLSITPAEFPTTSTTYVAQATIRVTAYDSTSNGHYCAEWRASWHCNAGTTSTPACTVVGSADDSTVGAMGGTPVTCTNSSGTIKFNLVTAKTDTVKAYVEVDIIVYVP